MSSGRGTRTTRCSRTCIDDAGDHVAAPGRRPAASTCFSTLVGSHSSSSSQKATSVPSPARMPVLRAPARPGRAVVGEHPDPRGGRSTGHRLVRVALVEDDVADDLAGVGLPRSRRAPRGAAPAGCGWPRRRRRAAVLHSVRAPPIGPRGPRAARSRRRLTPSARRRSRGRHDQTRRPSRREQHQRRQAEHRRSPLSTAHGTGRHVAASQKATHQRRTERPSRRCRCAAPPLPRPAPAASCLRWASPQL